MTLPSWLPLYPKETNAYLLQTLLHVHIRWPSFCLHALQKGELFYAFASVDHPDTTPDHISQLLREVLLSYRLLFGQSGLSRKLSRRGLTPSNIPPCEIDPLLPLLCTNAQLPHISIDMPSDRDIYFAAHDFPVYSERIELIDKEPRDARTNQNVQYYKVSRLS
ncbi:uncharacterized protein BDW47DRAFT_128600 [Aspergillus candidus]|uniref:Uncharacterized protein n=1 Tax=Aspergillus candidus TaxID=41067 RepID=A0A2I2F2Q5_ASPCN|nr:hypothetical protein BDW47DRAFT_128600 [Aspergillus candidus]PLB34913.1 hypothetical protein BDW47DRAFT_128600 [Aspergillus candidus]